MMSKFIDDIIYQELDEIRKELIISHLRLNQKASGRWINTLDVQSEGNYGFIEGQDYTKYLEEGRPKNKNQDPRAIKRWVGWAANTFIADWIEAKGLQLNPFAVAMNIALNGTKSYPRGGTDLVDAVLTEARLQKLINNVQRRVSDQLVLTLSREYARI